MAFGEPSEEFAYSCFREFMVSMGKSFATSGNSTATPSDPRVREDGMGMDTFQVSSWASGKIRPNRAIIKQKHIPSTGLDCVDLARHRRCMWTRMNVRTAGKCHWVDNVTLRGGS